MSTPKVEVRRAVYLLSAIRLLLIIVAVVVAFVLCICIIINKYYTLFIPLLHYDTTKKLDLIGNQKKILPRYVEYTIGTNNIINITINKIEIIP